MLTRPGLPTFDYVRPATVTEALTFLQEQGPSALPLMGGTDLFVRMRDGIIRPACLVDVKHLPGMRDISYHADLGLRIGAAATMNQVASHPVVRSHYPVLAQAAASVASYQLRNRATLGGNLCNGSPAADTAPAILVLDGVMEIQGPDGPREVPAQSFFLGPGRTQNKAGELLTAVRLPQPSASIAGRYLKIGRNKAGDLAIAGVAVIGLQVRDQIDFRIALASVAPVPLRARAAEKALANSTPDDHTFVMAAEEAMAEAIPIDDVRASAAYRKAMVRNLTLRGLREVWSELSGQAAGDQNGRGV